MRRRTQARVAVPSRARGGLEGRSVTLPGRENEVPVTEIVKVSRKGKKVADGARKMVRAVGNWALTSFRHRSPATLSLPIPSYATPLAWLP